MSTTNSNLVKYPGLTQKQRATMSFHAFLVIIIGSTAGFAWLISIGGTLELWPLPAMEIAVPDQKELWRNAHLGPIMHGMMVVLIASISPLMKLTKRESVIMVIASIIEVWGNACGFQSAPFTTNRGFTPDGPFINHFSYFTFYIAIVASFVILYLATIGVYRTMIEK